MTDNALANAQLARTDNDPVTALVNMAMRWRTLMDADETVRFREARAVLMSLMDGGERRTLDLWTRNQYDPWDVRTVRARHYHTHRSIPR